ncbi:hypothetical protein EAF04_010169 [Stromatinia cepivora]|nr:hypothetical protein EAF04_010169 [Stromatinia cepivora]
MGSHSGIAERNLSPTQRYQKLQPLVQLRKRHRDEPTDQPRKRRRSFPSSPETTNPTPTDPSQTSDITHWLLGVAKDTAESHGQPEDQLDYLHNMHRFLAEKKAVQRKRSSSSIASSSQGSQGYPEYHDALYTTKLEANGSFMKEYRGELPEEAKKFNDEIRRMLEREQPVPKDSLFSDDYFEDTMDLIQDRNEAFIIKTISDVMIPHVGAMTIKGASHLDPFIQSFDEGWNNCKKITQTHPKPDSAIGFKETALSAKQTEKIQPYLGDLDAKSDFKATFYMLFAFLTYEVNPGNIGLDIADRQNAHSMTIAVRALVALFRLMGREQELYGKILTISISFDHRTVRIYGYLPIIKGQNTEVWREDIDAFDFRTREGQYKWKCYQYSMNTLDIGRQLLHRIRSAIDDWEPDPVCQELDLVELSHGT